VQREHLGDQTGELTMKERGESGLVFLRRPAALQVDGAAGRRDAKYRGPRTVMDLFDRPVDPDAEPAALATCPVVNRGDESRAVDP